MNARETGKVVKILFIGPLYGRPDDSVRAAQKAALCAEVAHEVSVALKEKFANHTKVVSKIVTDYPVHVLYAGHEPTHIIDRSYEGFDPKRTPLKRLTDTIFRTVNGNGEIILIVDFSGQEKETLESLGFVIKTRSNTDRRPTFVRVGSSLPDADCPLPTDWVERRKATVAERAKSGERIPCPIASVVSDRILAAAQIAA